MKLTRSPASHVDYNYNEILVNAADVIRKQHAENVEFWLQSARLSRHEAQATRPDYRDEVSPFMKMKALDGGTLGPSVVEAKHNICKFGTRSRKLVPITKIVSSFERMSRYKHYIPLHRSILVADVRELKYEPYLGDDIGEEERVRLMGEYDTAKEPEASRRAEYAFRLSKHLPAMLKEAKLEKYHITAALTDGESSESFSEFAATFRKVFDIDLAEVLADELADKPADQVRPDSLVHKVLETYVDLGCSICGSHECGAHGEYESIDPDEPTKGGDRAPLYDRFNLPFESMIARRDEKMARKGLLRPPANKTLQPCSQYCYLTANEDVNGSLGNEEVEFTHEDLQYIKAVTRSFPADWLPYCKIADFLRKPCREVRTRILTIDASPVATPQSKIPKETRHLPWYDPKRKKIDQSLDWGQITNTHLHQNRSQPQGCVHPGRSCSEAATDCFCTQERILCDKYCGCPSDCFMKYTGCDCVGPCAQSGCTCWELNRECDPDLCHSFSSEKWHKCNNNSIQLGKEKPLVIGESSHKGIGYGVYLMESVEKGGYIIEYVGEVISHGEADRRGHIYDTVDASYLFDLNKDFNIDAFRYGNASRFINHDSNANCGAKVMLVNGEHRIGFWSTRAISAGQELFFDYGPKFQTKHGLLDSSGTAKGRGKARGGARRGAGRKKNTELKDSPMLSATKSQRKSRGSRGRGRGVGAGRRSDRGVASKFAATVDSDEEVVVEMEGLEMQETRGNADEVMMDVFADFATPEVPSSSDEYEELLDEDGEVIKKTPRKGRRPVKYTR